MALRARKSDKAPRSLEAMQASKQATNQYRNKPWPADGPTEEVRESAEVPGGDVPDLQVRVPPDAVTPHLLPDDPAQGHPQHPQLQARVRDGLGDVLRVLDEQLVAHRPESTHHITRGHQRSESTA